MVGPIALGKTTFYAKKGSGIIIRSLDDAKKIKSIGIYRDAAAEQILKKEGFTNLDTNATIPVQSVKMLMWGRVKVISEVNLAIREILHEAKFSYDDVEALYSFGENRLFIALSRGTPETMVQAWKTMLEEIHRDGTFQEIYQRWLPGEDVPEIVERIGIVD